MRKMFSFVLLLASLQVHAQYDTGLLPKDLLDKNSKAMITVGLGKQDEAATAQFNFVKKLVEDKFKDAGINPELFINFNQRLLDRNVMSDMTEELDQGITHHFMITIRQMPKTAADVAGYKKVFIYVAPFKGESLTDAGPKMGMVIKDAPDITVALNELHKTITSNPEYFEAEGEAIDFTVETKRKDGFPSDLPRSGVLVLKYGEGEMRSADYLNKSLEKYLTNDYPYKFKLIDRYDLEKEKSDVYKYLLYPTQEVKQKKVYYHGGPDFSKGQTANDTETYYYNYYVLRDLYTQEEYLGVKVGYGNLHQAMKEYIKRVKKEFEK